MKSHPSRRNFLAMSVISGAGIVSMSCRHGETRVESRAITGRPNQEHTNISTVRQYPRTTEDVGPQRATTDAPKIFVTADDWHAGDCVIKKGATLTLNPGGTANFVCTAYTNFTHNGDVWHFSFIAYAADGNAAVVWPPQPENTWPMNLPQAHIDYNFNVQISFPADAFQSIVKVTLFGAC